MDVQEELPEPPEPQEQKIVEMQPPKPQVKNLKDPQLGGLRREVQRERGKTRRQMQQIRRLRATKISQLREATGKTVIMPKKPKSQGLFGQMKNIVSRFFRKK
jgi:hypothetical protein